MTDKAPERIIDRLYDAQVCSPAQNYCRNRYTMEFAANHIVKLQEELAEARQQSLFNFGQAQQAYQAQEQLEAEHATLRADFIVAYNHGVSSAKDIIFALEAERDEAKMQSLADLGQAQDAYEAQLKAEAQLEKFRGYMVDIARDYINNCPEGYMKFANKKMSATDYWFITEEMKDES